VELPTTASGLAIKGRQTRMWITPVKIWIYD